MSDSAITPIGRDHPAHRYLVDQLAFRMREVSEKTWYAGWLINLEFILWEAINGEPRDEYLAEEDLRALEELSTLVGGWHNFDRFVPLDEWLVIAREHALQLRAGDPQ